MLTIGALSRATGIATETLRTWELRYGFPAAERKPSGHRVYHTATVTRLRRIAEALARGHRAGEVVSASDAALDALLTAARPAGVDLPVGFPAAASTAALLDLIAVFDADRLTATLLSEWSRLSPVEFLDARVVPLIVAVGDAWASGRFEIRHEHFLSERVGDLLRSLRLPMDLRASGPLVACATLPGEAHALGLQMAALVLASAGFRVIFLGTEVPPNELVSLARERAPLALALSLSAASSAAVTGPMLTTLRRGLPTGVALLLGGNGAPRLRGTVTVGSFTELGVWAQRAAAGVLSPGRAPTR
jgi:methanogenic corrinoid protein MtbC1